METKLNELVQQLVNGFEEQLEELRKENEMLIRLVWKWETGTAIPCSYCGRTLTDEELADEHNKDDNSKKSCPKCRVLYESNTTAECNSCYETKPCTVEEEDLKDGQEYYYCAECREDAKADAAEDEDEDEMQVYFETNKFWAVCGEHEHLKEFHNYHYYQCWGGGPEGGYIVNEKNCVFRVERSWGTPFSVEKVAGFIKEIKRDGMKFIRII